MPNAFQLVSKETGEAEKFVAIDEKLCAHLGVPCHPTKYYRGWYDSFGLEAAMGWDFAKMRESRKDMDDTEVMKMLDWFDEHYTPRGWYEHSSMTR